MNVFSQREYAEGAVVRCTKAVLCDYTIQTPALESGVGEEQCSGGAECGLSQMQGVGLDAPAVRRHGWVGGEERGDVQPGVSV